MAKAFAIGEKTAKALQQLLKQGQPPGVLPSRYVPSTAAIDAKRTSPTTVGNNAEGSESAESTTWSRGTTPVDVWVLSRIGYFHAGDEKLYAYFRKLSYDGLGALYAVSAETRVEIDAPDDC